MSSQVFLEMMRINLPNLPNPNRYQKFFPPKNHQKSSKICIQSLLLFNVEGPSPIPEFLPANLPDPGSTANGTLRAAFKACWMFRQK